MELAYVQYHIFGKQFDVVSLVDWLAVEEQQADISKLPFLFHLLLLQPGRVSPP